MKTKSIKKLNLTKETVASLEAKQMDNVKGGKEIKSLVNDCETGNITQCNTYYNTCIFVCW